MANFEVLKALLGPPSAEATSEDGFPGPVAIWAFASPKLEMAIVEFHKTKNFAEIYASPSDLDLARWELGIEMLRVDWRRT